jgi:hypothetical protein
MELIMLAKPRNSISESETPSSTWEGILERTQLDLSTCVFTLLIQYIAKLRQMTKTDFT